MERIGTLLRRLKLDPDSLQAAREAAAMKEAAPPREGTGVCAEPPAQDGGGDRRASGMGKMAGAVEAPAKVTGEVVNSGEVCSEAAFATRHHMVTRMPVGIGMRSATRPKEFPTPALRRSMFTVIEGGIGGGA